MLIGRKAAKPGEGSFSIIQPTSQSGLGDQQHSPAVMETVQAGPVVSPTEAVTSLSTIVPATAREAPVAAPASAPESQPTTEVQ